MNEAPILECHRLSQKYPLFSGPLEKALYYLGIQDPSNFYTAVDDVSFDVYQGQSIGIIGANGAGKSSLLSMISGTLIPTQGTIKKHGKIAAILSLGAGFDNTLTGRENIFQYGAMLGLTKTELSERYNDIVKFSELNEFIDSRVDTYSSGMYARLAFAVVAHVNADLLIIDEALSVGDARFNNKCLSFLEHFRQRGTFIFVSHSLDSIRRFCDHVIWMHEGKIVDQGEPKEICDKYYAFMNRDEVNASPINIISQIDNQAEKSSWGSFTSNQGWSQIINCFGYNESSLRHGDGRASIISANFHKQNELNKLPFKSLEKVIFSFELVAKRRIEHPILGFIIKDSLGQPILGGNSYKLYDGNDISLKSGDKLSVSFWFSLPILKIGSYSIVAAIGDGNLQEHVHVDWMHDAVIFEVAYSAIDGVMMGVPLENIKVEIQR